MRKVKRKSMTEETVRLSRKNQIVVPKDARKKLGLSSGDELIVRVDKDIIIMKPKPRNYTEFMRGLHKEIWRRTDASLYVEKERQAWPTERQTSKESLKGSKQ
jgi:AbrB family looped-hinge helix DNA binding protein